jgi:hypothetical protein
MLKKLLSVMLAAVVVSQGTARAEGPADTAGVVVAKDDAALLAHIEGLAQGDRIVLATDDGVVAGELVEKHPDDPVMARPLLEGGLEQIAIPRQEAQGFRYQPGIVPHATPIPWKTVAVLAAIVAVGVVLTSLLVSKPARR